MIEKLITLSFAIIASIYQNSSKLASVGNRARTERPSTDKSLVHAFLSMNLSIDKIIFKC